MIQLMSLFILFGFCIMLLGIFVLAVVIKHMMKINLNSKYKWIIILLHWLGLIFGAWLIMEGINATWASIDLLIALLHI